MNIIGYARVSTYDQNLDVQIRKLEEYGCSIVFKEKESGANNSRPVFQRCLEFLKEGDTLVMYKPDRLTRDVEFAFKVKNELQNRNIGLIFLSEPKADYTSPEGNLMFGVQSVLAQYQKDLISQRTKDALALKRKMGIKLGRPQAFKSEQALEMFAKLYKENHPIWALAEQFQIGVSTAHKYVKIAKELGMC